MKVATLVETPDEERRQLLHAIAILMAGLLSYPFDGAA
jgi:hypothetical protein